jgi:SAM-dependent methyltransferase
MPDSGFLTELYSEKYYNVASHSPDLIYQVGIPDSEVADQNKRRAITRHEVKSWEEQGLPPKDGFGERRRLLEIGGGRGYLQLAAAEAGWETLGLEISPHGIKAAIEKGLIVLPVTLDEFSEKFIPYRRYFDTVVFFDFLEHVTDPGKVLRMVRTLLKDEGTVVLRIPVTTKCPRLHLIDHIWHFSRESIKGLLQKEGYRVTRSHDSGVFRSPTGESIENLTIFAAKGSARPSNKGMHLTSARPHGRARTRR